MSEQIGKHKGAVETLLHEKKELSRILQIVNSQLQRHLSALEEAGVDTDEFIQQVQEGGKQNQRKQEKPGKQQRSKERQRSKQREQSDRRETGQTETEEDTDELLEGENDVGNRDFNPNR
jgi:septal ring factor EnvC (AmiA/AmiB activator)